MQYEFDVPAGQQVEVRLYFYDGYAGTDQVGERVFDVSIDGETVLDDFDIIEKYGDDTGAMESFTVTSDGTVDVDFGHVTENPQINAIEIVSAESQPDELGASPSSVDFGKVLTGDTEMKTVTLTNLGNASNSSHPDISVSDVSISGTDAGQFSHDFSGSQVLAPGESMDVQVTYSPDAVASHQAALEVSHSGTNSPVTVDLTGEGASAVDPDFGKSQLQGFSAGNPTALEWGPDGRLYVTTQGGTVYALAIERTGDNSYQVTNEVPIDAIKNIPNHDDFGNIDSGENNRQSTGLTVGGTASQPVVYVSSSDPEIDVGQDDDDTDTNSGAISRLTVNPGSDGVLQVSEVSHDVMVLGLPRSEENHATNGLDLSSDGSTLYVAQGGHTNKGAPGDNFGHTPEYVLSAAVLEIDLAQIENNYQAKNLNDYDSNYPNLDFYYAIPTIQNDDSTDGDDLPFGGEDGINQAKLIEGGPVQIYSPGYRNPYDLVLAESGKLYVSDHGPNGGWGGQPSDANGNIVADAANVTNHPNEDGSFSTNDQLVQADEGAYGGHAAPIRANPTQADIYDANGNVKFDITSSNSPVPSSMVNPVEADYIPPTSGSPDPGAPAGSANTMETTSGQKVLFGPTGGTEEYTASNFGGAMQGDILQVELGGDIERVELSADGETVTNVETIANTGGPLGIDAVDDDGKFPGTFWTANHGGNDITVFEPVDYNGSDTGSDCSGADDPSLDEDGDGYDNADEIDAGTDPCSSASTPPDFDDDGESNLNDPDDDNDGIVDTEDLFAVDASNGVDTSLPVQNDLSELNLFGDNGQGWTGLMVNGQNYQELYNTSSMTVGGAAEVLTVENVPQGDAHQNTNTQQYAFQFGTNPSGPFTVETTVNGLPSDAEPFQSQGIFIGTGDQDNYAKLTVTGFSSGGGSGVQLAKEEGGSFTGVANPSAPTAGNTTTLSMTVYPSNGTVEAYYAVGGGEMQYVGETTVPTSWFDTSDGNGTAVGVIATSNGASSTFDATWQYVNVEPLATGGNSPPTADAGSDQTVDENTTVQLDASGSSDPDGDQLGYTWTQLAGPSVSLSANDAVQPTFTAPDVDSPTTLTFELNVSDGNATDSDTVNVTVQDTDVATGETVFAVNSGGSDYTATDGTVYAADTNFDGGQTYSTSQSIGNTQDDPLYQTERYGDFWYNVSVPNGTYEVTLEFAEIYHGTSNDNNDVGGDGTNVGDRVFDVNAEGQQALNDYDIFAQVGSLNATNETFTTEVTDGELNLQFVTESDNAKVSAIEVAAVSEGDTNTAPTIDSIANQTVTEGDSTTVDVNASDADGDSLTLSLSNAPSFVSLTYAGDGNGTLSIAPQSGDAGTYQFDVVADDGNATATEAVNLTVEEPASTGTYGVETGETTNAQINTSTLTNASATMNGTLTLGEKTEATTYVKIWPQEQPEDAFWYTGETMTSSGEFEFDVVLSPSTTYVWQTLSQSGDGEWKAGEQKTFTTPTGQYFGVTTNQPSSVGTEWVTLEGEIENLGDNDNATVYFTYWKQGQKESTLIWYTGPVQESIGTFSADVQLEPNTTYEHRAFGQSNEGEWKAGPVVTFTTQDGQPYGVATDPATNVGGDSATLNGNLTGLGDYNNATVYFQYWAEGQKSSTLNWWTGTAQSSPGPFSADVTGLSSETTYVFQAYAQSDEGKWTAGSEQNFTTGTSTANQPPTASFTVNDSSPTVGQTVEFNASDSTDADGTITSYEWDFDGDGTVDNTTTSPIVTHAYSVAGDYTAELTATDDDGANATATQTVSVSESTTANASATIGITANSGLEASTYGGGSFELTNTGEQNITTLTIDLSSTSMPDMVWDPDGTAGDQAAKGLNINSESGDGVGVVSTADPDVFSQPHNGVNGSDGYDVLTIQFTDYEPGETVSFSADNDPTSIKGATVTSQEAGPVSGLELARATVTVAYDSTTQTTQTIGDGSQGGAIGVVDATVPAAPSIDAQGVTLDASALDSRHSAATVTDANQTITVSGPAGATVTLVQVEGELELDNVPTYDGTPGYEIEDYEANKAENVQYHSATIGSGGTVDVPVTLTNSTDVGGYNYFVAHLEDDDGAGVGSNVIVLKLEAADTAAGSGSADFAVTANGGIDASTYNGGSFEITNTGDKQLTSVTYDLGTGTFPDVVFDPDGTAGDSGAKGFTPDSGGSATGLQDGSFAAPHNGVNGSDGYDQLTATFDDFDNGETFTFSVDIDPTSIKGASGTGAAGSVSGLEMLGATVTVAYADGTTQTTHLFGDGSDGGSQATAKADVANAPSLGVEGVSLDSSALDSHHSAATVSDASQKVTISGPAGATVELLHVEGQLELANQADGYNLEEYEANTAEQVSYQTVTLDSTGQATVAVTLTNTSSSGVEGGFNHFVATVQDADGETGNTSNVVVLKLDESSGSSTQQVLHRVNAGESQTLSSTDDGPDWTGVAGTSSPYLVSVGASNTGNYCGGDDITPTDTVPESTPDAVFDCERYGNSTWAFSVASGQTVEVRLYIGNQFSGASEPGDRQFNVSIEGEQVLTNYDPVADVGHANGTMKSFTVTDNGDGSITVVFEKGAADNAIVNGIEILEAGESDSQ